MACDRLCRPAGNRCLNCWVQSSGGKQTADRRSLESRLQVLGTLLPSLYISSLPLIAGEMFVIVHRFVERLPCRTALKPLQIIGQFFRPSTKGTLLSNVDLNNRWMGKHQMVTVYDYCVF